MSIARYLSTKNIVNLVKISCVTLLMATYGCTATQQKVNGEKISEITFEADTMKVLRNPAMGWVMYNEGWELYPYYQNNFKHLNVDNFWREMDAVKAHEVSNILYIRAVWSAFEPEEGKYAWDNDPNFIKLIDGAKQRKLKLAFRVFHHSDDQVLQATPEYVFKAGADNKVSTKNAEKKNFKNPYYDDPVFTQKLDKFVAAFGKKFDDPSITDFVDGYGAGLWGEGHGVTLKNSQNAGRVIDEITGIYAKHFTKVLTVYNLSDSDWKAAKSSVFEKKQFLPRRDGLGSYWFSPESRELVNNYFYPKYPLIAEGCYWLHSKTKDTTNAVYKTDKQFKFSSWKEALSFGMEDALNYHANVYDLRVPLQAEFWINEAPEAVQKFITHGGYRLFPSTVSFKKMAKTIVIESTWQNSSVGILPNHHPNWNNKYRVAWGLKHKKNAKVDFITIDQTANPGDWVKGTTFSLSTKLEVPENIDLKNYTLVTAIVNTTTQQPELELALTQNPTDKWYVVSTR